MLSHKKRGQKLSLSCMQHDGWLERNICAPLACSLSRSSLVLSVAGCPKSWQTCLTSYHPISDPALVLGLTGFLQELSATEEVRQSVITHNARLAMQPHAVVKRAHFVQEKKHLPNIHEGHYTGLPVPGISVPTPNCFLRLAWLVLFAAITGLWYCLGLSKSVSTLRSY